MDERGIVTLLQQIRGQFVSPFRALQILSAMPADEQSRAAVAQLAQALFLPFRIDVRRHRLGRHLAVYAGPLQLPENAQFAYALVRLRAGEGAGIAGVVEPLLLAQPRNCRVDIRLFELLRSQLPA
jgi:hypothetical protein